jgi:hypothetical protein
MPLISSTLYTPLSIPSGTGTSFFLCQVRQRGHDDIKTRLLPSGSTLNFAEFEMSHIWSEESFYNKLNREESVSFIWILQLPFANMLVDN